MRCLAAWMGLWLCLVVAASAQTPPAMPPAAVPADANPLTGARPGNEIGTGNSLPRSDQASNITSDDTTSPIAPNLPTPAVGENAGLRDYLLAARNALAAGRTGEAQQALEMAETRELDRSVPLFQTNTPAQDPVVDEIGNALRALSTGDRLRSVEIVNAAIARLDSAPASH